MYVNKAKVSTLMHVRSNCMGFIRCSKEENNVNISNLLSIEYLTREECYNKPIT